VAVCNSILEDDAKENEGNEKRSGNEARERETGVLEAWRRALHDVLVDESLVQQLGGDTLHVIRNRLGTMVHSSLPSESDFTLAIKVVLMAKGFSLEKQDKIVAAILSKVCDFFHKAVSENGIDSLRRYPDI
jgi:hypothetical protein